MKTKPTTTLAQYFNEIQAQFALGSTCTFSIRCLSYQDDPITLWEMQYGILITRQPTPLECFQNFHDKIKKHTQTMNEIHGNK